MEPYVSATGTIARIEAVDIASEVAKSEIAKLHAGVVGSLGTAGISLINVCLVVVSP